MQVALHEAPQVGSIIHVYNVIEGRTRPERRKVIRVDHTIDPLGQDNLMVENGRLEILTERVTEDSEYFAYFDDPKTPHSKACKAFQLLTAASEALKSVNLASTDDRRTMYLRMKEELMRATELVGSLEEDDVDDY